MADVRTVIDVDLNTSQATAKLRQLQKELNSFALGLNKGNILQAGTIKQTQQELSDLVNQSRFFTGETVRMRTAASRLDSTLSRGSATMGQFLGARFQKNSYAAAQVMGLANERARIMQTQFVATSAAANGFQNALAIRPLAAFNSAVAVSTQKLAIQRAMFRQATTSMINFGKNVQWAGRQLMVGFTVPLTIFGAVAGKAFRDLEKEAVNFRKVYGDVFTTEGETEKMLDEVKGLSKEFTKYGIAAQKTMQLAAIAAQAGQQGADLIAATREATRLSTLGDMEQQEAMRTTIALQSAFKLSSEELADSINYLNFVENSSVLSLQDLAGAIPRVAPVIVGLGGNIREMAIFLTAMREGGVSAAEAANGLKSSLGRLITPSKQAKEMAEGFGISLENIVKTNRGDLLGTVMELANAMKSLGDLEKQQLLSTVFGKFQFARIGALFENITREGSQANRLIQEIGVSTQQLSQTADKELSAIENSIGTKFTKSMEDLKIAIAPIGELFVKLSIPIIKFLGKIAEAFNNLPDFAKNFIAGGVAITGIFIPAVVMIFGLLANLGGQLLKMGGTLAMFVRGLGSGGLRGAVEAVRQSFQYMSLAELDTIQASQQLATSTGIVNRALLDQVLRSEGASAAILELGSIYDLAAAKARNFAAAQQSALFVPGRAMAISKYAGARTGGIRRNTGGTIPGFGPNKDTVPAVLTPGEYVVNREATRQNLDLLQAINDGRVQGFNSGGIPGAGPGLFASRIQQARQLRSQMARQEEQSKQLQKTHLYFSGKRRNVSYGDIDPRIGGSQVDDIKQLSKLGFPVEQLDDKYLLFPFNKDLIKGIKGSRIRSMIGEMDPGLDILGPAFKRANVSQPKLIENLLRNIDDRTTYYDFGPNALGTVIKSSLGGTRVQGLPSQLRLGTKSSMQEKFPNEVAIAMSRPGQQVPVGNAGAYFVSRDGKLFVGTPGGTEMMTAGTRGQRLNRGGGVAGNILGAFKGSRNLARAAYGSKYPPMFSPAIPGTRMYGFGEGARQPMLRGAPGEQTTILNLIKKAMADPRLNDRGQFRFKINGQEVVANRLNKRSLDRLQSGSPGKMSFETRPITDEQEQQLLNQWIASGRPGRGDEETAFANWMRGMGYKQNRNRMFYKPAMIDPNEMVRGEVLIPRSAMGMNQGGQVPGLQYFRTQAPQRVVQSRSQIADPLVSFRKSLTKTRWIEIVDGAMANDAMALLQMGYTSKQIRMGLDATRAIYSTNIKDGSNALRNFVIKNTKEDRFRTVTSRTPIMNRKERAALTTETELPGYVRQWFNRKKIDRSHTWDKKWSETLEGNVGFFGEAVLTDPKINVGYEKYIRTFGSENSIMGGSPNTRKELEQQWKNLLSRNSGGIIPRYNQGGNVMDGFISGRLFDSSRKNYVPGVGDKDTVPAALTPGEFVINKDATRRNLPLLRAINGGAAGYAMGGVAMPIRGYAAGDMVEAADFNTKKPVFFVEGEDGKQIGPLTGSKAKKLSRKLKRPAGMGGMRGMGASMGLGMGGMGLMMIGEQMKAKAAQSGSTSAAGEFMSMGGLIASMGAGLVFLKGPMIAVVAAIAALGGSIAGLVVSSKEANKSLATFYSQMYGSAERTNQIAKDMGRQTASQQIGMLQGLKTGDTTAEALTAAQQFVREAPSGQQLLADIKAVQKAGGDAIEALRNQLTRLIVSGVINQEEASAIAIEIGSQLNNQQLAFKVNAEIKELVGIDGQKIKADGILNVLAEISPQFNEEEVNRQAEKAFQKIQDRPVIDLSRGVGLEPIKEGFAALAANMGIVNKQQIQMEAYSQLIADAAAVERDTRAQIELQLKNGVITAEQYLSTINKINTSVTTTDEYLKNFINLQSKSLGISAEQLRTQQSIFAPRDTSQTRVGLDVAQENIGRAYQPYAGFAENNEAILSIAKSIPIFGQSLAIYDKLITSVANNLPLVKQQTDLYNKQEAINKNVTKSFEEFAESVNMSSDAQAMLISLSKQFNTEDNVFGGSQFLADVMSGKYSSSSINAFTAALTNARYGVAEFNKETGKLEIKEGALAELGIDEKEFATFMSQMGLIEKYPALQQKVIDVFINQGGDYSVEQLNKDLAAIEALKPDIQGILNIDVDRAAAEGREGALLPAWANIANQLAPMQAVFDEMSTFEKGILIPLMISANGEVMSLEKLEKFFPELRKQIDKLMEAKTTKQKKQAIMDLLPQLSYVDPITGKRIDIKDVEGFNPYQKLLEMAGGEKKLLEADPMIISQAIEFLTKLGKNAEKVADLQLQLAQTTNPIERAFLIKEIAKLEQESQATMTQGKTAFLSGTFKREEEQSSGGGGQESLAKELARRSKEAQEQLGATETLFSKQFRVSKEIIAGPFGPEFIEYIQSQGKRFVDLIKQGAGAVNKAYKDYLTEQNALAEQARKIRNKLFPQQLKVERGKVNISREFILNRDKSQEDVDFAGEQMGEARLRRFQELSGKSKLSKKETKELKEYRKEFAGYVKDSEKLTKAGQGMEFIDSIKSMRVETEKLNDQGMLMDKFGWDQEMASAAVDAGINIKSTTEDVKIFTESWNASKKAALVALGPEGIKKYLSDLQSELNDVNKEIAMIQIVEPLEKQMRGLEKQNNAISRRIELLERTKEPIQNEIDQISRIVDLRQRDIELLGRRIEPLEEEKEKLDEIYQAQIEALDKVSQKEDLLFRKRQGQLNVAQALSRGDVAGAAQAALAARQDMASARMEQTKKDLDEQHKERIKVLDDEIKSIRDQQKLIELEIRDYQDQIYNLGLLILPIDDQIKNLKLEQRDIQDQIYDLQLIINDETERLNEIYNNTDARMAELIRKQQELVDKIRDATAAQREFNAAQAGGGGGGGGGGESGSSTGSSVGSGSNIMGVTTTVLPSGQTQKTVSATRIVDGKFRINKGGKVPKMAYGGRVSFKGSRELPPGMALGGSVVPGMGNLDIVPAMLTPGEYVVNKASARTFMPLLESINNSKFPSMITGGLEKIMPDINLNNINFPTPRAFTEYKSGQIGRPEVVQNNQNRYNNYSVNVNVSGNDISPNSIANAVIGKIRMMEDRNIRSVRT